VENINHISNGVKPKTKRVGVNKIKMKTNSKTANIIGLFFVFLTCFNFGYEIARQIWGWGTFNPVRIIPGVLCVLFAIIMFRLAKKKRKEENQS
jgi:hypothetical protein